MAVVYVVVPIHFLLHWVVRGTIEIIIVIYIDSCNKLCCQIQLPQCIRLGVPNKQKIVFCQTTCISIISIPDKITRHYTRTLHLEAYQSHHASIVSRYYIETKDSS